MKDSISHNYEVIVIGAGHAGCEAGLVAARMGMKTAMFCTDIESVAMMPCNPSIGGTGKGHLVREIDALGGEMGVNTDKTFIQSKMLNTSKGPAVHSLRAQADKHRYHDEMLRTIEGQERLDLICAEVSEFIVDDPDTAAIEQNSAAETGSGYKRIGRISGIRTADGTEYSADAVVICTGTFLGGKIFIGDDVTVSGPAGLPPACARGFSAG